MRKGSSKTTKGENKSSTPSRSTNSLSSLDSPTPTAKSVGTNGNQQKGKKGTGNKFPLNNVICCVETFNSDGIDSSNCHIQTLKALGAQVENGGLRAGLTHMIWANGNIKHLKAAEFMDILVVSPLWVEQCRESSSRAPEIDFLVTADNVVVSGSKSKVSEPIPDAASALPEPSSPSLDSSKRGAKSRAKESKPVKTTHPKGSIAKMLVSGPLASDSEEEDEVEEKESTNDTKRQPPKKATQRVTKAPATTVSSDCRMIALSGFEGEERVFLTDLIQSIITSIGPGSSTSSSSANFGLILDNDLSLSSLRNCSHIVASTNPMRRSLRVIFGMVFGIPIVTDQWLHSCLENRQWMNVTSYLHPRFDRSKNVKKKASSQAAVYVAVGNTSDPSLEVVRLLTQGWSCSRLAESVSDADFIIIDNQKTPEPTIYEVRALLSNLFKKSSDVNQALSLLEEGKILTCKSFFDCIESGKLEAQLFFSKQANSRSIVVKEKKSKATSNDIEPEEVSKKRSRKGTPKKVSKSSTTSEGRRSPMSPIIEPIKLSIPVEDSPPMPSITRTIPSPHSEDSLKGGNDRASKKRNISPPKQSRPFAINFNDDDEDEEASPTPRKSPAKKSRLSASPPRSRLVSHHVSDDEEEWNEDRPIASEGGEEASPSW